MQFQGQPLFQCLSSLCVAVGVALDIYRSGSCVKGLLLFDFKCRNIFVEITQQIFMEAAGLLKSTWGVGRRGLS